MSERGYRNPEFKKILKSPEMLFRPEGIVFFHQIVATNSISSRMENFWEYRQQNQEENTKLYEFFVIFLNLSEIFSSSCAWFIRKL